MGDKDEMEADFFSISGRKKWQELTEMLKSEWYAIAKNNAQNTVTADRGTEHGEPRQSKTSETSLS